MLGRRRDSGRNVVGVGEMCWRIGGAIVYGDIVEISELIYVS